MKSELRDNLGNMVPASLKSRLAQMLTLNANEIQKTSELPTSGLILVMLQLQHHKVQLRNRSLTSNRMELDRTLDLHPKQRILNTFCPEIAANGPFSRLAWGRSPGRQSGPAGGYPRPIA